MTGRTPLCCTETYRFVKFLEKQKNAKIIVDKRQKLC